MGYTKYLIPSFTTLQVNDEGKRTVLGDILYEIRFPTMTLEEFGENVANCGALTDTEARYLFTLYSKTKPSLVFPFKEKRRMGRYQLLEFHANSVSNKVIGVDVFQTVITCTLNFAHVIHNIEISEIQFCQPSGTEAIDAVFIQQIAAKAIFKMQNKTYYDHPVYTAIFEPPFRFSYPDVKPKVQFQIKRGQKYSIVELQASTQHHSFNIKGIQTTIYVQETGAGSNKRWYCLTALKLQDKQTNEVGTRERHHNLT